MHSTILIRNSNVSQTHEKIIQYNGTTLNDMKKPKIKQN